MTLVEGKRYSLSELASLIKESSVEAKPRIDRKIINDDIKNNGKAVDDIMKGVKAASNVAVEHRNTNPEVEKDLNKTTLDYDFAVEPSDSYKERVKAQVHGFPSAQNEKDSKIAEENEGLDFDGNKKFYEENAEKNKKMSDAEAAEKKAGLKSRELPNDYQNKTLFDENKKMKRLHFSHTVFLNEEQMIARIPEDYKTDGNRFIMKDAEGTEYLVECIKHPTVDYVYTNVISRTNNNELNESMQRIKELSGYTSSSYNSQSTSKDRLTEDRNLSRLMHHTRNLMEQFNEE